VTILLYQPPTTPSPPHLKQLQVFHHSLPCMKPINNTPSPSSPPFALCLPQSPLLCTYFTILSFIINSKVNVQRVSCCILLYYLLWSGQPLPLLNLTPSLLLPPHHSTLSIHIAMPSTFLNVMYYDFVYYHSLFLSLLLQVPLLQTCSTYKFVYDHV
jgi:hypothetical protein